MKSRIVPATKSVTCCANPDFAARLLDWFASHGRHDLPWQQAPDPYRIWISEIMLQQTQVSSVIAYFDRFMARFPSVSDLAAAPRDEVLALWAGLGYYARARNLHDAAHIVVARFDGVVPTDPVVLRGLPGIGPSTAAAIAALATGQRHAILDGNVKRVLARYHMVAGWPGRTAVERRLWELAWQHTPQREVAAYTQAIMDLGATVCTRARPDCWRCPVADGCASRAAGRVSEFPRPRPRKAIPHRATCMLLVHNHMGEVLLQRRPPAGIWGGLWSLPELDSPDEVAAWCRRYLGVKPAQVEPRAPLEHTFTHFRLHITPLAVALDGEAVNVGEDGQVWLPPGQIEGYGVAAPVRRILDALASSARAV